MTVTTGTFQQVQVQVQRQRQAQVQVQTGTGTETGTGTIYLYTRIRNSKEARLHAVLEGRHGGLDGPRRDVSGAVDDEGGEGARHAGLKGHGALAEETGVCAGVGGQAQEHVEQLKVGG